MLFIPEVHYKCCVSETKWNSILSRTTCICSFISTYYLPYFLGQFIYVGLYQCIIHLRISLVGKYNYLVQEMGGLWSDPKSILSKLLGSLQFLRLIYSSYLFNSSDISEWAAKLNRLWNSISPINQCACLLNSWRRKSMIS